jgi:hypothetical protein
VSRDDPCTQGPFSGSVVAAEVLLLRELCMTSAVGAEFGM